MLSHARGFYIIFSQFSLVQFSMQVCQIPFWLGTALDMVILPTTFLYQNFEGSNPPWHWQASWHLSYHWDLWCNLPPSPPLAYSLPCSSRQYNFPFPKPISTPTIQDPYLPKPPTILTLTAAQLPKGQGLIYLGPTNQIKEFSSLKYQKSSMTYYMLSTNSSERILRGSVIFLNLLKKVYGALTAVLPQFCKAH